MTVDNYRSSPEVTNVIQYSMPFPRHLHIWTQIHIYMYEHEHAHLTLVLILNANGITLYDSFTDFLKALSHIKLIKIFCFLLLLLSVCAYIYLEFYFVFDMIYGTKVPILLSDQSQKWCSNYFNWVSLEMANSSLPNTCLYINLFLDSLFCSYKLSVYMLTQF